MAHELLYQLYLEDIDDRQKVTDWSDQAQVAQINSRDKLRRQKTQQFIDAKELVDPQDYYRAALIFQHGDTVEDYQQAHHLARESMNLGHEPAKWMFASTFDRWNLAAGKPQVYGTQFVLDAQGQWQLAEPIDRNFPDAERIKYNVPPLEKALKEFKKRNQAK